MSKLIKEIVLNQEQRYALEVIRTGNNAAVLGSAGTGKTALIKVVCKYFMKQGKRVKKVCFQGLAAQLIGGTTIHGAFGIPFNLKEFIPSEKNVEFLKNVDVLIIDEIGMVSRELLDIIGDCLAYHEGKLQIIVVGDFYQIEPVHKNKCEKVGFAFESFYWDKFNFSTCILEQVVRQGNREFIEILQKLRVGNREVFKYFMTNMNPKWMYDAITICTHREDAKRINERKLSELNGEKSKPYCASYEGKIDEESLPGEACLVVKKGMRVMSTLNSKEGYQNGSMGEVVDFDEDGILVRFDYDGKVHRVRWARMKVDRTDAKRSADTTEVIFMPLRPAYAITIHKSQGQTFDKVNIVIGQGGAFAHGQLYVALTRCRSIENTHIQGNIYRCKIAPNPKVKAFYDSVA